MISWAQIGYGAVLLGLVAPPDTPVRRVTGYAALCGLAAFLVDVYLY